MPSVLNIEGLIKILIYIQEGIQKNSYERHAYESVDEKSLPFKLCLEKLQKKKRIRAQMG